MGGAAFKETTHEQRIRLRKWMSIISLFPMMNEKDFSMRLPALWLAIGKEPVESIRLYGEWFVSMGMIRFRCGLDDLLDRLQDYTTPTGLVVSFITVLGLVARSYLEHPISSSDNINSNKVDSNENDPSSETLISLSGKPPPSSISNLTNGLLTPKADSNFIKSDCVLNSSPKNNSASSIRGSGHTFEKRTIFDRLQPWLLHNCHTVRLYALHVYDRLWSCLEADDKEKMPEGYCNIITFVSQSLSCRRLLNSVEERIKHPFLNRSFDPIANFNLARVFSALPRFPSERISPYSFENILGNGGNVSLGEGDHFVTATTIEEHRHAINQKQLTESIDLKMVLQQKADPWDMTGLDRELASEIRRRKGAASEDGLQIILVASLLEKAPNLGGLCRTAEIMGASKLIVANASIVKDSTFSAVSMTAEQWIDIEAVLPSSLCSYLVSLKSEDYRVIAVEQASITSSLERFQLPSNGRVCLVLGNERFGIPVEVLHVADECVTIPQFGLVRSLNAHVAGALVMWEMRRQFTDDDDVE